MVKVTRLILILSVLFCFLNSQAALKEDYFKLPEIVAVQNRQHDKKFELASQFGYFPSNAFNRYYSVALSGTYKFHPNWSWEVLRYDFMIDSPTSLKNELEEEFGIEVNSPAFEGRFLPIRSIARSGLVWEPFYNKGLFANRKLIYSNLSLVLNVGHVTFKDRDGQFLTGLGAIYKVYVSKSVNFKIDLRQTFVLDSVLGTTDFVELSVGFGYSFGDKVK